MLTNFVDFNFRSRSYILTSAQATPAQLTSAFYSLCDIGLDQSDTNLPTLQSFHDFLSEQNLDLYSDTELGSICAAASFDHIRRKLDVTPLLTAVVDSVGGRLFNKPAAANAGGSAIGAAPPPFKLDQLTDVLVAAAKAELENCGMILQYVLRDVTEQQFLALQPQDLAKLVFSMGLTAKRCGLVKRGRVAGQMTDDLVFVDAYTAITGHLFDMVTELDAQLLTQVFAGLAASNFKNSAFVHHLCQGSFQKLAFFRQKQILTVLEAKRQLQVKDDMLLEGFARLVLKRGNARHMEELVEPLEKANFTNERLIDVLRNGGVDPREQAERERERWQHGGIVSVASSCSR